VCGVLRTGKRGEEDSGALRPGLLLGESLNGPFPQKTEKRNKSPTAFKETGRSIPKGKWGRPRGLLVSKIRGRERRFKRTWSPFHLKEGSGQRELWLRGAWVARGRGGGKHEESEEGKMKRDADRENVNTALHVRRRKTAIQEKGGEKKSGVDRPFFSREGKWNGRNETLGEWNMAFNAGAEREKKCLAFRHFCGGKRGCRRKGGQREVKN